MIIGFLGMLLAVGDGYAQDCKPRASCCMVCDKGKPCGSSCIRMDYTCKKSTTCACWSHEVCSVYDGPLIQLLINGREKKDKFDFDEYRVLGLPGTPGVELGMTSAEVKRQAGYHLSEEEHNRLGYETSLAGVPCTTRYHFESDHLYRVTIMMTDRTEADHAEVGEWLLMELGPGQASSAGGKEITNWSTPGFDAAMVFDSGSLGLVYRVKQEDTQVAP